MLERGTQSLYNPSLLTASKMRSWHEGLSEHFIRRDKSTMTYVFYQQVEKKRVHSGKTLPAKTQKQMLDSSVEVMRARFKPELLEFWLFNAKVPMALMDDESNTIAKLYWNRNKKQYVLKNRYCTRCSQHGYYYCDEQRSRAWPFMQELLNFSVVSAILPEANMIHFFSLSRVWRG